MPKKTAKDNKNKNTILVDQIPASASKKVEKPKTTNRSTTKPTTKMVKTAVKPIKKTNKSVGKSTKVAIKTTTKPTKNVDKSTKKPTKKFNLSNIEYYDIPYRYNETTVKLLAQTPTMLFVYWDISDTDRKKYGNVFFENTEPVLLVYNETLNYSFYVNISDFANNWYIPVHDADCVYQIQLGRIYKNETKEYTQICSSNNIQTPNNVVLLNKWNGSLTFKNIQTGEVLNKIFKEKPLKLLYSKFIAPECTPNNPSSQFNLF